MDIHICKEVVMTTAVATRELTAMDRCDRCGAQAYVRVVLESSGGELLFCGHHARQHEACGSPGQPAHAALRLWSCLAQPLPSRLRVEPNRYQIPIGRSVPGLERFVARKCLGPLGGVVHDAFRVAGGHAAGLLPGLVDGCAGN